MLRLLLLLALIVTATAHAQPTVYLIGDSTVKNGTAGQKGWGEVIGQCFDLSQCRLENRALGGRSSRSFMSEGLWEKVRADLKPGDFVIMQFGHNDGGSMEKSKGRASIKGSGDDTREIIVSETGKKETVLSFGGYLSRYINDTKAAGATPIVCSLVPRNIWQNGKVLRSSNDYAKWAKETAAKNSVAYIPLNDLIADQYDKLGEDKIKTFFPSDHTHTNELGAKFNAAQVTAGIRALHLPTLSAWLKN